MARKNWDRKKQIQDAVRRIEKRKRIDSSGCWIYTGGKNHSGYGRVSMANERHARTHRIMFEHVNGPVDSKMDVCHKCDVPSCFNPDHLFLGTRKDNMKDAKLKGRTASCEKHWKTKLSNEDINEIKKLSGKISQNKIGKKFGVSQFLVSTVIAGNHWRDR